jgi:uncharacterized protein YoxC
MMNLYMSAATWAQGSPSDTVAMVVQPTLLSTTEAVATIVLTVAVLGVLVALFAVLLQLRKLTRATESTVKRLGRDATPVMERAKSVAENVDFIAMAVRTDVQKLNESVSRLSHRLKDASIDMEKRIQDFTALVEILQAEAEDLALDTAAAVRGVRAGTRSLAGDGELPSLGPEGSDVLPPEAEGGRAEE